MIELRPQAAHWGAFTAVVEDERIIAAEPFSRDPDPSPIIHGTAAAVHAEEAPIQIAMEAG